MIHRGIYACNTYQANRGRMQQAGYIPPNNGRQRHHPVQNRNQHKPTVGELLVNGIRMDPTWLKNHSDSHFAYNGLQH